MEEKSEASSPSADEQVAAPMTTSAAEAKEETAAASPAAASPVEEKKEEPTPSAPTPVPSVEDKKEEAFEKVEAEKKVVEVSQSTGGQSVTDPVEVPVYRVQPVATPSSIIERKTSEELPSLLPSSPPPTPIDPSPLQQARQAAASASALAEALKLPAEAVDKEEPTLPPVTDATSPRLSHEDVPRENCAKSYVTITPAIAALTLSDPSADSPPTIVPAKVESPPVVEARIEFQDVQKVGEILATSSRDNEKEKEKEKEEARIAPKVESVSENPVAMEEEEEEVSEYREREANRVEEATSLVVERDTEKQSDEPIDSENTRSESATKSQVGCPLISKVIDPFDDSSAKEGDPSDEKSPAASAIETASFTVTKVSEVFAMDQVMDQTLPVAECQMKNKINSCAAAMKTNVSSDGGFNENLEAEVSVEIETNDASMKQHLSSENFKTERMSTVPSETIQRVEKLSVSDLASENKMNVDTGELSESLSSMQLVENPIEIERCYMQNALTVSSDKRVASVNSPTELFINSEEGPLSVSEDILVEAIPAMVIPEDDNIDELTDTTESFKVMADRKRIENEPESDTVLPTEETLISEELEDVSVPEESLNVAGIVNNEAKTIDVDDMLPSPPFETLIAYDSQISEAQSTASALEAMMTSREQIEIERCFFSPKGRATSPDFSPVDSEATQRSPSRLSDAPTCTLSERSSDFQTRVLSPGFDNVPVSLEDLPPAPEDTGSQTLDSFDYPLPPDELACPSPPVVPANVSVVEPPPPPSPPVSIEHAASPRDPTETLLTPPASPNSRNSNVNTASGIATNELTTAYSYDRSDVESKESLAVECPAKTESQDGALSCQLSNTVPSTAVKKHHQVTNMQPQPPGMNAADQSFLADACSTYIFVVRLRTILSVSVIL